MRALVFGVDSGFSPPPIGESANPLLAGLATVPMALQDADPALPAPDWVVLRPRRTGICGSDAKQVFMDMGGDATDFSLTAFISFPQVLGHEVVATLAVSGVHAAGRFEWSPWYFREVSVVGSNAFGVEEVDGVRKHAIEHYLDFASSGRVDISAMLTHTFRLDEWRDAFTTIAEQHDTGAIKVAFDFR